MDLTTAYLIVGGLIGGFVSGLSGFGAGLVTLPILLFVIPPTIAAQLAALSGAAGQLQTLPALRRALSWSHVAPMTLAGIVGVALALWLIPPPPIAAFKVGVGLIIIAYCLFALVLPASWRFRKRHPVADIIIGLAGGIAGGIAGIPGPPVVMWAALQSWSSDEKRTLIQTFNVATLSFMLLASGAGGLLTTRFFTASLVMLPSIIIGAIAGVALYRRVDDRRFHQIVIVLLLMSGIALVVAR